MPTLTIDNRRVDVPPGSTILDAARRLGIDIPTLCHLPPYAPSTSCLVCVVKLRGRQRLVPACATAAVDGMEVESDTPEVHQARRTALELLLSDHLGDCVAPCELVCPMHMDVPLMLRQIRDGQLEQAIATIKRDMALPAVLGHVCGRPCEKGCRRAAADGAVAICTLKAQTAQRDLASPTPYLPPRRPDTGRRVAIVGAGPCGLSAAYHLALAGHRVTLLDDQPQPGGRLRREFDTATLPAELLDAEIAQVLRLGVHLQSEATIADRSDFDRLRREHDAVLVACGQRGAQLGADWGLAVATRGIEVDKTAYRASLEGVFAAGCAIRAKGPVVRDVADGKEAAAAIDTFLTGSPAPPPSLTVRSGRLEPAEITLLIQLADAPAAPDTAPGAQAPGAQTPGAQTRGARERAQRGPGERESSDPLLGEARRQAARCLHCDCRGRGTCRLKHYAEAYDARPTRYQGTRRHFSILRAASGLVYEPGKCIDCGLCIQVAATRRDLLGLTFIGRGFDVRVGVPLDGSLDEALADLAAACAAACPTAALSITEPPQSEPRP